MRSRTYPLTNLFEMVSGTFRLSGSTDRTMLLFAFEGVLIALINNIIGNNNYLFATRLGASDFQISLVGALQTSRIVYSIVHTFHIKQTYLFSILCKY